MRLAYTILAASVVGGGVAAVLVAWHVGGKDQDGQPIRPKPKIAISRETTFIAGPLTEDGYIDYLAALNAIGAKGVTAENNAAIPLYRAFGTKDVPRERREHVAKCLGIQSPPDEGKYFIDEASFAQRKGKDAPPHARGSDREVAQAALAPFERARERPWSPDEFPLVAAWLKENEQVLDLIVAASGRERFYFPLVGSGDRPMVIEALLPMAQQARQASRALVIRAMLRLKEGKIDEAWADVLACHRLGRLVAQGPTIIECLVGIAIEGVAAHADAAIAHHGGLSGERARRFAEDLKRLPPLPKMADKIGTGERFMFLDAVSMLARRGPAEISRLAGNAESSGFVAGLTKFAGALAINWEEPLRMGNAWYDRFVEAFAKPTRVERDEALRQIEADVKQMARQAGDFKGFLAELVTSFPRRAVGRQIGRILVALLLPAISSVAKAEDRGEVYGSLGQVALALAAYRAERGEYPAELTQLVPNYLAAIPEDPFANAPLRYKRKGAGCLVYSINVNGKDDGGASFSMNPEGNAGFLPDADDVTIFLPFPERK